MPSVTAPTAPQPLCILSPDGTVPEGYEPPLAEAELVSAFRMMLFSRAVDERAFSLQRQGRLGTFSTVNGQEASVIGSALALDPVKDWVVPQYRELPAMIYMGYSLTRFLLYFMGNPSGNEMPEGCRVLPFQISLAAQIPHAVGLAWAEQLQGRDGVSMVYFGDGASSEGDAHEAMNLAGVRRTPTIFWLQNNGWAISTPVAKQTAAPSFAVRAEGYGIAGELVDGNDLFACVEAARRAVSRGRAGEGATLVESRTYRLGPHNTADDPTRYVDPQELTARRALDPISRVRTYLLSHDLLDADAEKRMQVEIAEEIAEAIGEAESWSAPHAGQMFEHVYGAPPLRVRRQWEGVR